MLGLCTRSRGGGPLRVPLPHSRPRGRCRAMGDFWESAAALPRSFTPTDSWRADSAWLSVARPQAARV